ncbi:3-keto-steroid reductase [Aspergillus clavatus NRRL 1]|uniref:3-ketosteroid reductase n=1 Tax=Aspergillus clavatus (strain ATCC 1007 / CBS 513.65 / DSM 816 / NCTC 3887 / NRRL 1 / QM 1276 / 107) TaxID=344612 RepID=A1CI81_ASPCL|nr:3-ketosteroid reductase [Aspergillus clavatus NRRL 1]EAW10586.1 3-ketosteroid reductase [Aspergillus clavatus NRRL 1]
MTEEGASNALPDSVFVLVTGANSGLGFSICCRLVDDFLKAHQNSNQSLTIIFTTRSTKKGNDTLLRLQDHLRTSSPSSSNATAAARVTFIPENVDLSNLVSVRALSRRLNQTLPKLDAIVLNAGLGGWTGIHWPKAIWGVLTDLVHEVSWPSFKLAPAGMVTDPQTSLGAAEPRLGAVFCANVFGHYMLAHNVMPLLQRSGRPNGPGRVIWVSSLEASANLFDIDDLQGLRTLAPYESSKALTDILALTSNLPSTAPWVRSFYSTDDIDNDSNDKTQHLQPPNTYLTHPGICGTGILPLSWPLFYAMLCAFWLARLLGSPWHTVSTYMGACAPVWLALAAQSDLDAAEAPYLRNAGGRAKWGSSCSWSGRDAPASTEVDGWGYGGVVGPAVVAGDRSRRRKRGAADLTVEEKERFEELGRKCWQHMEELRVQWDQLLDQAEAQAATAPKAKA